MRAAPQLPLKQNTRFAQNSIPGRMCKTHAGHNVRDLRLQQTPRRRVRALHLGGSPMLALSTTVCALVLPGGHYRAIQGRTGSRIGFAAMKLQGREEREALEERNSITAQPGRAGRFRDTLSNFEADADWLGFIGNRVLDAVDDTLHRDRYLDDDAAPSVARKRVVVLGSGWGANAVLSQLKNTEHEVQVVSPRNYFLFTPMLAGAALGTLEPRSIIEPIREAPLSP